MGYCMVTCSSVEEHTGGIHDIVLRGFHHIGRSGILVLGSVVFRSIHSMCTSDYTILHLLSLLCTLLHFSKHLDDMY